MYSEKQQFKIINAQIEKSKIFSSFFSDEIPKYNIVNMNDPLEGSIKITSAVSPKKIKI